MLNTVARPTRLQRIQFGPFLRSHALLDKYFQLPTIIKNISMCNKIIDTQLASQNDKYASSLSVFDLFMCLLIFSWRLWTKQKVFRTSKSISLSPKDFNRISILPLRTESRTEMRLEFRGEEIMIEWSHLLFANKFLLKQLMSIYWFTTCLCVKWQGNGWEWQKFYKNL